MHAPDATPASHASAENGGGIKKTNQRACFFWAFIGDPSGFFLILILSFFFFKTLGALPIFLSSSFYPRVICQLGWKDFSKNFGSIFLGK